MQLIVNDGGNPPLDSAPASVRITAGNRAPVANADSYSVAQDTTLNVNAASGVLANDTDADGDPLTAALVTSVTHGALTLNANGSFTYSPTAGYSGPDTFTYRVNDGTADSNTATVSLTVTPTAPTNHPPVANAGANQNATVGQLVQLSGACTDVDGDPTTPTWGFTSKPSGSAVALSSTSILNPTF
ncbi:MAG TPA: Ig-like domain-containing protein, partial [Mycobacteriales bacterium]|nr:Ig-like domain-containing protein [Mycobacteriales bacterium]